VLLEAGWNSLHLEGDPSAINQYRAGAHGFLRLKGQSVLAVRAQYDGADRTLPPYEQFLLGGGSTLRGHSPGEFASDKRLIESVEIRAPLGSPMGIGKAGVRIFYDAGQGWNVGERRSDAMVQQGAGAGVFLLARLINISLDGAANLSGGGGRLHFGFGLRF
jgi:hemolysin activation/secretion protein